jgi:hypothetical protein
MMVLNIKSDYESERAGHDVHIICSGPYQRCFVRRTLLTQVCPQADVAGIAESGAA